MAKFEKGQLRTVASIAVVIALSVVMFGASARLTQGTENRHPENLTDLVRQEVSRQDKLLGQVETLQTSVTDLTDAQVLPGGELPANTALGTKVSAGSVAVTGPGAVVSVWDAPRDTAAAADFQPDDLVVHQQDLQAVINALWAGGAEAMSLQGQRVTNTTAFRCVGNVLLLHGQVYSPPYVVQAVGDPQRLQDAIDSSPEIEIYQQYVEAVGLGWSAEFPEEIEIPASSGSPSLKYAEVPDGVSLWD